jgi:preprotein translocase subunit YajC
MLPILVLWFGIFYLLVFRPQSKAKKAHEQMLKQLKKHDEVVAAGGIIGTVMDVRPDVVTLRVADTIRLSVERSSVSRVIKSAKDEAKPIEAKPVEATR